ncbi:Eukaryotic and archaeal DNA primase, large subunit [uncultured archaeon]|nr:Eukaryotic and archaeal DNA primase, large subunit [uncultured archaeon]
MEVPLEKLKFAMRYPFTRAAKEIMSSRAVKIDFRVMERATKRVADGILRESIPVLETSDRSLLEAELLSYPIARMIVSSFDSPFRHRYINGEVNRVRTYLFPPGASEPDMAEAESLADELGIEHSGTVVSLRSYLLSIPKDLDCRLILQRVHDGNVILDDRKFLLVAGEASRNLVETGLPIMPDSIPAELKKDVQTAIKDVEVQLKGMQEAQQQRAAIAARASGVMAPCMTKIIERARAGENLPHFARVAIATYLFKIGKSIEDIMEIFSHTPNFNDKTTRYQLEFIQKKGYSPPSCQNMDTYGLRLPECKCLGVTKVKNPMQYGFKRTSRSASKGEGEGGGKWGGRRTRSSGSYVGGSSSDSYGDTGGGGMRRRRGSGGFGEVDG